MSANVPTAIAELEARLYETLADGRQIKLARLVSDVVQSYSDADVNIALENLARRSDVKVFGDHRNWRRSEVRRTLSSNGGTP